MARLGFEGVCVRMRRGGGGRLGPSEQIATLPVSSSLQRGQVCVIQFSNDCRVEMPPQPIDLVKMEPVLSNMVCPSVGGLRGGRMRGAGPRLMVRCPLRQQAECALVADHAGVHSAPQPHGRQTRCASCSLPTPRNPSMQYRMNGGTNISLAIQRAGQLLKPLPSSTRRVLVLLTDGRIDSHQVGGLRSVCGCGCGLGRRLGGKRAQYLARPGVKGGGKGRGMRRWGRGRATGFQDAWHPGAVTMPPVHARPVPRFPPVPRAATRTTWRRSWETSRGG